ncbi:MAG: DNA polymerase III subunit beta [Chlamydiia bacterium]|nr:DNA polymerase III subunit beta [Chlamydiia bacterium]
MKFIISTQELNYLISKVQNVVPARPTIPLLGNVLLEAKGGMITLTATDLLVGIRCTTEAKIEEEGATTLPAKKLASLTRELTAVNLEVSTDDHDVTEIVAGTSRFKLNGMDKKDFSSLPDLSDAERFKIDQTELRDMLYRTAFAVSREDTRYVLTGVGLRIQGKTATFTGTDGKRLARAHTTLDIDPEFSQSYIIPPKAVDEFMKSLTEEGEATVFLSPDKIAIDTGSTLIVTKLLQGEYPDVSRVIPEKSEVILSLHREELMTLLRQVSLFVPDTHQSVRFSFLKGELKLSANSMDVGEGKVSMPVNYHGSPLEIAFNPSFFLDILRHSKEETITMGLTDPYNPGVIIDRPLSEDEDAGSSPLFVIMPMRLSEE